MLVSGKISLLDFPWSDSESLIGWLVGQKLEEQRISVLEFVSLMCVHYTPARVFWLTDKSFLKKYLWFEYKYVITIFCNLQIIDFLFWKVIYWSLYLAWDLQFSSVQVINSVRLDDSMNCSTPGLPVHHQLLEFTQTHVHQVGWCHPAISSSVISFSSCP